MSGRSRPGDRVPSTREVADALGVARATVTSAYEQLVAEGYFDAARGAGTFVSSELPDQQVGTPRRGAPAADRSRAHGGEERRSSGRPPRLSEYGARLPPLRARVPTPRGTIDLSRVGPDLAHFPYAVWRRLLARHLRHPVHEHRRTSPADGPVSADLFARAGDPAGYEPLRREVAAYVAHSRAVHCDSSQVVIVSGSQQALDLCMRVLVNVGEEIAVEEPGYPGTRDLAIAHGARINMIRIDSEGMRVGELRHRTRLVCVTPSHQFPTGTSMSLRRRFELLHWARTHGAVILEDDYDSEYRYSGPPLPALQGLAGAVPVIYMGTFSNVMYPAMRLGYVIAPPEFVDAMRRAKWLTDRFTALHEQAALADFICDGHLERHVRRMRRVYKRRREALTAVLTRHFGDAATVYGDAAGMHLLVRFAIAGIAARAKRQGVRLLSADAYYSSGRSPNEFIFGFSAIGERTLIEGIRRLAE
jgi:GntR family transcriptional regulator/MocR family aminotransferase